MQITVSGLEHKNDGCQIPYTHPDLGYRERGYYFGCPSGYAGSSSPCTKPQDNTCPVGNPIQPGLGAKTLTETDFSSAGTPLKLVRYYNSFGYWQPQQPSPSTNPGLLGDFWRTNYDRRLFPISGSSYAVAAVQRPDGRVKYFDGSGAELQHFNGNPAESLIHNADGTWTYTNSSDEIETYNAQGQLVGLWDRTSLQQTLTYDNYGRLATVTDAHGRSLTFLSSGDGDTGDIQTYSGGTVTVTLSDGSVYQYTVDPNGNLTTASYPGGVTRQYSYEDPNYLNALTGIIDENGNPYEAIDYDPNRPGRAIDSYLAPGVAGNTIDRNSFTYSGDNTSTTVVDPLGQSRTLAFTTIKGVVNLVSVTQPCGSCGTGTSQSRTYDTAGYLQSTVDFNGNITQYTYDDVRGLETQRIEAANDNSSSSVKRTINTIWDPSSRQPDQRTIVNAFGITESETKWVYNSRGQVLARCEIDPAISGAVNYTCNSQTNAPVGVRQRRYSYCETGGGCPLVGELLSVDGPRTDLTDSTTYSYYAATDFSGCATQGGTCHALGDIYTVTNAIGQVTTYVSYDKNGRVTRTQDANGTYTDFSYNARGWLLTRTVRFNANGTGNLSQDATTTFTYDNAGSVTKVMQPPVPPSGIGSYLTYTYDAAHRLTDIADNANNKVHYTLDAMGNRTDEKTYDPSSNLKRELARTYDQLGRLTQALNAADAPVQTYTNPADSPPPGVTYTDGYDGNGNEIYSIDGTTNHVGTEQLYDPLNRLVKTLQDHTGVSSSTHDAMTQYVYDTRDNLRTITDPDGLATNYTYDGLNNLTQLNSPDTGSTTYGYDTAGNRTAQTDARLVQASYGYDALNRLISVTYPTTGLNVTYAYDQANGVTQCGTSYPSGRLTNITDSSGSTTYCYDRRGNVVSKKQVTNGVALTTTYAYTLADRLANITYPSGALVTYGRNVLGQVTSITYKATPGSNAVTLVSGATYYPFGPLNVLTFGNGRTLTKAYDQNYAIDQVVSSATGGLVLDASVDVLGNIVNASSTIGANPPTQVYSYDPLYRLTQTSDGSSNPLEVFTYNKTGDRLSQQTPPGATLSYSYVPNTHHLTAAGADTRSFDSDGNTTSRSATNTTYTYDDRNRMSHVTITGSSTNYGYLLNGRGERVAKQTYNGGTLTSSTYFDYSESGQLLGEYGSTGTANLEYIYLDHVPVAAVQPSGTVYYVETDYLGTPRNVVKASDGTQVWRWDFLANVAAFGEGLPNPQTLLVNLRFPGQYYDAETGLHYNYFRDYEPGTGRYVESDPMGQGEGVDTYSYVESNPLNGFDPTGLLKVYGYWCGPDWTGGWKKSWNELTPWEQEHAHAPKSPLDSLCMHHDICYGNCGQVFLCDMAARSRCLLTCDRRLINGAKARGFWGNTVAAGIAIGKPYKHPEDASPKPDPKSCSCQ